MKILRKRSNESGVMLTLELMGLDNVILVFLYDSKRGLGTLAFAIPSSEGSIMQSTVLVGGRYKLLSRILAERVSSHYGKPVLALVRLHIQEEESMRSAAKMLKQLPVL